MKANFWLNLFYVYHILNVLIFVSIYAIHPEVYGDSIGYALIGSIVSNLISLIINASLIFSLKKTLLVEKKSIFMAIFWFVVAFISFDLSTACIDKSSIIVLYQSFFSEGFSFKTYARIALIGAVLPSFWLAYLICFRKESRNWGIGN